MYVLFCIWGVNCTVKKINQFMMTESVIKSVRLYVNYSVCYPSNNYLREAKVSSDGDPKQRDTV